MTADGKSCPHPSEPGDTRCASHARDNWTTGGPLGLSEIDVRTLRSQGVTRDQYEAYPRHIVPSTIRNLIDAGISPADLAGWSDRFNFGSELVALISAGISPAQADAYPERFSGNEIVVMHEAGISPHTADQWSNRFDGTDITYLARHRLPPGYCEAYPDWMAPSVIWRLTSHKVTPDVIRQTAHLWSEPLDEDEITQFLSLL